MCEKTNYKTPNPRIDKCMEHFVKYIQNLDCDVSIKSCCCGHNKYPMTIVAHKLFGGHIDLVSGIKIPRKRNFYKRDKYGYYYIPEVKNETKRTKTQD